MRANPSVLSGVGIRRCVCIALTSLSGALAHAQPEESVRFDGIDVSEWIDAGELPYSHALESLDSPRLLVVEQGGIDVRIRLPAGGTSATPSGRVGPEFIYVAPGDGGTLTLEPAHAAAGSGFFRIVYLPLDSAALVSMAQALSDAGEAFGSGTLAGETQACAMYDAVSSDADIGRRWQDLATLLYAGCLHEAGQQLAPERLDDVADGYSFVGVPAYRAAWLKGEHLHAEFSYPAADRQLRSALLLAQQALADRPAIADGIRHDVAEIQAVLGGNAALLGYIAGGDPAIGDIETLLQFSADTLAGAIADASQGGNAYVLSRAWDYQAALNFVRDDEQAVIDSLLIAKAEMEKTGNREWLLPILGSIGDFHKRWGELRAAQAAYLESLSIVEQSVTDGRFSDVYDNVGELYFDLGDYSRARTYLETAVELSLSTGREARGNSTSRRLARTLEELGDYALAAAYFDAARNYFASSALEAETDNWSPYRIMAQSSLSRIEHKLGNLDRAWELSVEVLEQIDERALNVSTDFRSIYINHANILFDRGDRLGALTLLDQSIEDYASEPMPLIDLLGAKMQLLQRTGSRNGALAAAREAFELIESQRAQIDVVRLGAYWSGRTNAIYASHVDYLLNDADGAVAADIALAFDIAERARATNLRQRRLEMLLTRNESNAAARAQWISLVNESSAPPSVGSTEAEQLEYERRLTAARERYFALNGSDVDATALTVRSLDEVQAALAEDALLLVFVAAPERMWRFDITRDRAGTRLLGSTADIETLIEAAEFELSNVGVSRRQGTAELGSVLLGGLADDVAGRRLLVSASSNLSALPFAALELDGRYVADFATVINVPSISEFLGADAAGQNDSIPAGSAEERSGGRLQLAVLADPDFGNVSAPDMLPASDTELLRSWADTLERLPASGREAASLGAFYAEDERRILLGRDATQANFFDRSFLDARIIHIATHGYFNERMPELIGFATAQDGPDDDGFVSLAEISARNISAELVVISACSTARGAEIAGEGSLSLARTFLAQGVGSVISTLWPVSDAATARFMSEFYRAVNEDGQRYAEALRTAQNALRNSRRFRDPFYWSAYTLTTADARAI